MNLRDHLQPLEECLLQPDVRHSATELELPLAPAFTEFGSSGRTFNRAEMLAELQAEPAATQLSLTHFQLVAHTENWALVTYRSTRTSADGATRTALRSSTWIRTGEHWQILFHQGTPSADPPSDPTPPAPPVYISGGAPNTP